MMAKIKQKGELACIGRIFTKKGEIDREMLRCGTVCKSTG